MNVATLPKEIQEYIRDLEERAQSSELQIETWHRRYNKLEAEYKLLLLQKFGRKSERGTVHPDQPLLFADEAEAKGAPDDDSETVRTYSRKKRGRKPIDGSLPREEVILDIPDEEKVCACGHALARIGEETSERLQVILPKMWVERIIRPRYACRHCEGSGDEEKPAVRIAAVPPSIIPKSIVTPGLLAFIITNKFVDHLPYYRQEARFERIGIHISRQNMSNWQQGASERVGELIDLIRDHIRGGPVINMDETPVQVLGEPGRKNTTKSYMWLARGGPPGEPARLYTYRETRSSKHVTDILGGFAGYLQTDGYKGYEKALAGNLGVIRVGCFAHARRKFFEAGKVAKKSGSVREALKHIGKLYTIETALRSRELGVEEFVVERKKLVEPVLAKFHGWLEARAPQVPSSVLLGEAIRYTLNEWPKLIRYLESPYLKPDNNVSEQAIRPFVLGRKNWLFSGSPAGAESSCVMYSLIETAKENGLNPYEYLCTVFERAPLMETKADWETLLPWKMKRRRKSLSSTRGAV